ncbi:6946_t:CDS:2 [Scutellospora calospora]|uniref:6946_t:CDS:1 n=1 Tax=Scutellospora calospora TaxID=85575 RepID=A0ACA9K0I2_9GLOM|nr:6946_t:CDS:2 [Scutellospora calospora]
MELFRLKGFCEGVIGKFKEKSVSFNGPLKTQISSKKANSLSPDSSQRQLQQTSYLCPSDVGQIVQTRSRSSSISSISSMDISEPSSSLITPATPPPSSPKVIPSNPSARELSSPTPPLSSPEFIPSNPSARQFSSPTPPLSSPKVDPSNNSVRQFSSPTPPLSSPKVDPSNNSIRQISSPTSPLSSPKVDLSNHSARQFSSPLSSPKIDVSNNSYRQFSSPTPPLSSPNVIPSNNSSRQFSSPNSPLSSPRILSSSPSTRPNSPLSSPKVVPSSPSARPNLPLSSPKVVPSSPSVTQFPSPPLSSPKTISSNSSARPSSPLSSPKTIYSNSSARPNSPLSSPKTIPYNHSARPNSPLSSPKTIPSNSSARPNSPLSSPKVIYSNPSARSNSPLSSPKIVPSNQPVRQFSTPTSPSSSPTVLPQIFVDDVESEIRHKRRPLTINPIVLKDNFDDDDNFCASNNSSLIDLSKPPVAPFMYDNPNDSTNESEDVSSDEDDLDVKSIKNIESRKTDSINSTNSTKKEKVLAVDDYGFVHKVADNEIPEGADGIQRIVQAPGVEEKTARTIRLYRDRETKWVNFVQNMDPSMARDSRKIKKLVRLGIPESIRGRAWQLMAGVHKYRTKGVFDVLRNKEKLPIYEDIEKDVDRCYPDHIQFREKGFGQDDLYNILKAYAHYDDVVGYCQGMGRLVGMMLMQMPAEDTFWLLVATIKEYMCGYFAPDLPQIKIDSRIFELLLFEHDPKLAQHFRNESIDPILYIPKWFLTIFTMVLPWASVLRVWDIFYFEDCTKIYILKHCPTNVEILEFLGSIPHELLTPDLLLDAAFKIKLKRSAIKRLAKKATDKNNGESDKKLKIDGIEFKLIGDGLQP